MLALPMTDFHMRPARGDEAELLTALSMRSKQSNGYDDAFMAACAEELLVTPDSLADWYYWVAETDGRLLGLFALAPDAGGASAEVAAFFVEPDLKGQGVGRALWRRLTAQAAAEGIERLRLDADPAAEPFYLAMGCRLAGRRPSGSIPGRTLPHMTFDLAK